MNKSILFLSIAACLSSLPTYANNVENNPQNIGNNGKETGFPEDDYKRKLESFLMDDEDDVQKKEEKEEKEVENKESVSPQISKNDDNKEKENKSIEEKNEVKNDESPKNNLEVLNYSSLKSDIDNVSFLLGVEINKLKDQLKNKDINFEAVKSDLMSEFKGVREVINEKVSSNEVEAIKNDLEVKLSNMKSELVNSFDRFYSQEEVDEKMKQIEKIENDLVSRIDEVNKTISTLVSQSSYEDYKVTLNEKINKLEESLNENYVNKNILEEDLMSLRNKIEGNSLSLNEKDDLIKDLEKNIEKRLKETIQLFEQYKENLGARLSSLEESMKSKQLKDSNQETIEQKNAVIEEQNKKIKELSEKYDALFEEVSKLKSKGINRNVIKVDNLDNLNEAEKKVQEDGGVLILDKNGQLKVLN